jgi:hypothetical protein
MLFDLRSRGRRRTVQAVYVGLALLFLVGFLGFGVGGGFGGGGILENVFGNKEGKSAGFSGQIESAEKRIKKNPGDAEAWAKLADARLHEAGASSEFFDEATEKYTSAGKALLVKVASDWNHYMSLNPSKPNLTVAQEMLRVYSEQGLNQPAENVKVLQQVVIPNKPPSASWYGDLAAFAYQANNPHLGDLASRKTLDLTPAKQRTQVKEQLERLKANPSGNPANEKYTSTVNGKKYNFKLSPNGKTATGSPAPTSTTKTSTAKK